MSLQLLHPNHQRKTNNRDPVQLKQRLKNKNRVVSNRQFEIKIINNRHFKLMNLNLEVWYVRYPKDPLLQHKRQALKWGLRLNKCQEKMTKELQLSKIPHRSNLKKREIQTIFQVLKDAQILEKRHQFQIQMKPQFILLLSLQKTLIQFFLWRLKVVSATSIFSLGLVSNNS